MHTELTLAETVKVWARDNTDQRIGELTMTAEVVCTPLPLGKNTELTCTFSWLEFEAKAAGSSLQERVDLVMRDWSTYGKTAKVTLTLAPDGHIKDFDVDGLERRNLRDGLIGDTLRGYFKRLFAPLDLPLTTDERDWIRGWEEKGVGYLLGLPYADVTAGSGTIKHRVESERLGLIQVFSEGRGTVGAGAAIDASATGGLVDLRVAGEAWIDPAGALLSRGFSTDGRRIASSSDASAGRFVSQNGGLQRVDAFAADHSPPVSVLGLRAPRIHDAPPALPEGVALVEFSSLGMQPLFIQGMPQVATGYDLPKSEVKARVVVSADGHTESAKAYDGYELLVEHVERGLAQARFPARGMLYGVDCAVEVRP